METLAKELRDVSDKFNRVKMSMDKIDLQMGGTDIISRPLLRRAFETSNLESRYSSTSHESTEYAKTDSYLTQAMAKDMKVDSKASAQCFFDAAVRESLGLRSDILPKTDIKTDGRNSAMISGQQFYTTRSDSSAAFEFSRFLLELSSESCSSAVDVARVIDARTHSTFRPPRADNDTLTAVRNIRI